MESNEETLALEVAHNHALSADFLGTERTVRHVHEGWQSRLVDRQSHEPWEASGGTSMRDRGRAKIAEIPSEKPRHLLPPDVGKQIKAIADRAVAAQSR